MPDRIALITGANQGVGKQVAKELAEHGVTVLVGSRDLRRGEEAAAEIGLGARAVQIDVTDHASIAGAAALIETEFGRLDLLVSNAGISNSGGGDATPEQRAARSRASTASLDEVRAVWEVNVFGVLAVYQAMLPLLRKGIDARIVNVSSGVGSLTANADPSYPYHAMFGPVYPASKAAENAMTLAMMVELEVDRHQDQPRLPGLHEHRAQQLQRDRVDRGRVPRGRPRRAARTGRPDRHVHPMGEHLDPVVTMSRA